MLLLPHLMMWHHDARHTRGLFKGHIRVRRRMNFKGL